MFRPSPEYPKRYAGQALTEKFLKIHVAISQIPLQAMQNNSLQHAMYLLTGHQ